jgi:hypothetical protein
MKSFNGCWTCRLRRKKCDENYPSCDTCATLFITCHYDQDKPEWMDGGPRQEEMAKQFKREVKFNAERRRGERIIHDASDGIRATNGGERSISPSAPRDLATPIRNDLRTSTGTHDGSLQASPKVSTVCVRREAQCVLSGKDTLGNTAIGGGDSASLMFYLDQLLPFLFPFYRPSPLQGGKAWILEMMTSRPVVRQVILCQSFYFISLARGVAENDAIWDKLLTQTGSAFEILRQALQLIDGSSITEHLHGAVRIMASIMQVQRFEIAILSFHNCQAHLDAALALFRQILDSSGTIDAVESGSSFNFILNRLGPTTWNLPFNDSVRIPSAEQAAFRFSSALLIFDDIIASTVRQEQPRLRDYQRGLLTNLKGANHELEPLIDLETVVGCQNWALLQISDIAVLDAWKQQCIRSGNLDVMELVHRAVDIKASLETRLVRLENDDSLPPQQGSSFLDALAPDGSHQWKRGVSQSQLVTKVWAHAALLYLSVVVSGWQPANTEVCNHVDQIVELLTRQISPLAMLRTMTWPFCVAGCLAEPAQQHHFRQMVEALQPPSIFGTIRKALELMENAWSSRNAEDAGYRDLATCFRSQGDLVLLV